MTKDEFTQILDADHYDFLWVLAHSTPGGHALAEGERWNACDYYAINAIVNFVQIEGYSAASYVWEDHGDPVNPGILKLESDPLPSNILFSPSASVLVIALSKSWVFPDPVTFYDKLREGVTFGRAFLHWSVEQATNSWLHGGSNVLVFGDPFIRFGLQYYYCPIYTALEGTLLKPRLFTLRMWRDRVFLRTRIGRLTTRFYYQTGPALAVLAGKSKRFRTIIRWMVSLALRILDATGLKV